MSEQQAAWRILAAVNSWSGTISRERQNSAVGHRPQSTQPTGKTEKVQYMTHFTDLSQSW
ncbi:MAG: hypothetical protein MK317_11780 [Pseudomonadales bacterium]|nr:hypothetical protein [Pseudomonadales bacterium]